MSGTRLRMSLSSLESVYPPLPIPFLREVSVVILPVHEEGVVAVPDEGERRPRVGPMPHWGTDLVEVLLARDHAPLVRGVVTDHPGICKVRLKVWGAPVKIVKYYIIAGVVDELGHVDVPAVDGRPDECLLLPEQPLGYLHHLCIH